MTKNVNQIAKAMKELCGNNEAKIRHFVSVYTLAKTIGELEKLPEQTQEYLEISALVCDIDDSDSDFKKHELVKDMLQKQELEFDIIDRVCYIVENFDNFDHITGLDHQILLEAHMIVDFKEKGVDRQTIIKESNSKFMTNYGRAFLKKAFSV
ncbi:MAG: hypothetical protein IJD68_03030 [Ruminococcus sp.]|nr:hypothetical protein [Ruminococcus sp.]